MTGWPRRSLRTTRRPAESESSKSGAGEPTSTCARVAGIIIPREERMTMMLCANCGDGQRNYGMGSLTGWHRGVSDDPGLPSAAREPECEPRAFLGLARHLQSASHRLCQLAGDGKPEARTVVRSARAHLCLGERLEDRRMQLGRNAASGVAYRDARGTIAAGAAAHHDRHSSAVGELHRLAHGLAGHARLPGGLQL